MFIPILLMGGIVGRLFREFAVTLSIAIAVSAVVSLTLTPMMCLAPAQARARASTGKPVPERPSAFFDWILAAYDRGAAPGCCDHQLVTLLVTFATVALTVYLYIIVPKGLFPQQDTGTICGFSDAPQDISFPAMKERAGRSTRSWSGDPDVDAHRLASSARPAAAR